ncbi:MAG: hypothetical protein EOM20_01245 [Spartobacteria bacterium]|nr:hypothetical protein [Spartobacteria bacterium]
MKTGMASEHRRWARISGWRTSLLWLVAALVLSGCVAVPFAPTERVPVEQVNPEAVRADFLERQPADYQLINTIVFRYRWHTQAAVGYLTVDHPQQRFALAALTHMGVKLLELHSTGGVVECRYAMPELSEHIDNVAAAIGQDIQYMYFNLVPAKDTPVRKTKNEIIYAERTPSGMTEYIFAGPQPVLVEKRIYQQDKLICRIRYYEYQSENHTLFPGGILLQNQRHGYRLEVRLKEIMSLDASETADQPGARPQL